MAVQIGVIGVGEMGFPILKNLAEDGFPVVAYARRSDVCAQLRALGIRVAETPKELASLCDVIFDVLTDTNATYSVLQQENKLLESFDGGRKILVDMTTSDPEESLKLAAYLESVGVSYMDCPITGGKIGAENRALVLMAAGDHEIFTELLPIFESLSKKVFYLGKCGSGHYMKLIHNQLSHSTFLAACEAVSLGKALGMDPQTMIDVFNAGNARSYATEIRFPQFILPGTFNAGASFNTVQKDIGLVVKKMRNMGLSMPITQATFDYWTYPKERGNGQDDYSTIYKLMEEIHSS